MKKGDTVIVIAGKEKGKKGVVARVLREEGRVVLEGLNLIKRHKKGTSATDKGGIVEIPAPMHISNVKLAEKKVTASKKKTATKEKKGE